jgi:O-succinylbenzoate synthase
MEAVVANDIDPIERVVLTHLQVPLKESCPGDDAGAGVKNAIVVTVETSGGIAHGESSPGPSDRSIEACWDELSRSIAPGLLGRSVESTRCIAEVSAPWSGCRAASAGAETALWDLLGQARRATVSQLLGADDAQAALGVQSGLVMGLYPSVVELLKAVEPHLDEGYRRLKIRIAPGQDLEFVRAVRQHFEDVPLMVDGGGAYTTADLDLFRELDDLDLLMIEQPFAADDVDGLAELQKALVTPICLDETAETHDQTAEAIRRGACRIVSLKIQRTGGLGPARAIHDLCFQQGVACWVGSTPELGLGQAFGVHLATLANSKYPADLESSARWFVDDYVAPEFELSSPGLLAVPDRPGVGYQVDPQKFRRYQIRQETFSRSVSA